MICSRAAVVPFLGVGHLLKGVVVMMYFLFCAGYTVGLAIVYAMQVNVGV